MSRHESTKSPSFDWLKYPRHIPVFAALHHSSRSPFHLFNTMRAPVPLRALRARPLPLLRSAPTLLPRRTYATPQSGPQSLSSGPIKNPNPLNASTKTALDPGSRGDLAGGPSTAAGYPDYSKGPSALDKASQLFFFTEIVRGEFEPPSHFILPSLLDLRLPHGLRLGRQ